MEAGRAWVARTLDGAGGDGAQMGGQEARATGLGRSPRAVIDMSRTRRRGGDMVTPGRADDEYRRCRGRRRRWRCDSAGRAGGRRTRSSRPAYKRPTSGAPRGLDSRWPEAIPEGDRAAGRKMPPPPQAHQLAEQATQRESAGPAGPSNGELSESRSRQIVKGSLRMNCT